MIDFSFAHRSSERRTNFHHLLLDCYKDLDKYFYFIFLFASLANCFPFHYNSSSFSFLFFLISPSTICISLSLQLLSLKMSLLFPPPSSIFFFSSSSWKIIRYFHLHSTVSCYLISLFSRNEYHYILQQTD